MSRLTRCGSGVTTPGSADIRSYRATIGDTLSVTLGYIANARADFIMAIDAARAGNIPAGADPAIVQAVMAELISDPVETEDALGHFLDVLAAHGLQRITAPTP